MISLENCDYEMNELPKSHTMILNQQQPYCTVTALVGAASLLSNYAVGLL